VAGECAQGVNVGVNGCHLEVRPSSSSTCTSSLWRDRSNPAYNIAWSLPVLVAMTPTLSRRGSPHSLFMAFRRDGTAAQGVVELSIAAAYRAP